MVSAGHVGGTYGSGIVFCIACLQDIVHIKLQIRKMSDANSQDLSTAMTVISANIEGLTASKHPCYQICASDSTVTVCVSKRLTEHHILQGRNWNDTRS